MFGLNKAEVLLCLVVVLVLFGTRRLPELGSGIGQAIQNFRKAFRDGQKELNEAISKDDDSKNVGV